MYLKAKLNHMCVVLFVVISVRPAGEALDSVGAAIKCRANETLSRRSVSELKVSHFNNWRLVRARGEGGAAISVIVASHSHGRPMDQCPWWRTPGLDRYPAVEGARGSVPAARPLLLRRCPTKPTTNSPMRTVSFVAQASRSLPLATNFRRSKKSMQSVIGHEDS